jgi:hypothetical protein
MTTLLFAEPLLLEALLDDASAIAWLDPSAMEVALELGLSGPMAPVMADSAGISGEDSDANWISKHWTEKLRHSNRKSFLITARSGEKG